MAHFGSAAMFDLSLLRAAKLTSLSAQAPALQGHGNAERRGFNLTERPVKPPTSHKAKDGSGRKCGLSWIWNL